MEPSENSRSFEYYVSRRVSFVLTTKDRADYLEKALDAAQQLVTPEDELIVVDGGSSDRTREVVERHSDLVHVFVSEPDISPQHALNKGILLGYGKYVMQLRDDDLIFPAAMEQAVQVLENNPSIDVLYCGGFRQLGDVVRPVYVAPGSNYGAKPEDVFTYGVCGIGIVIRRSALSKVGLFNPLAVADDGEFMAQAIWNRANVKFCRINLFHHYIYDHSVVVRRAKEHQRDVNRIVRTYCSKPFYLKYRVKQAIIRNRVLREPGGYFASGSEYAWFRISF